MGLFRRTLVAVASVAVSLPVMVMPAFAFPLATLGSAECPAATVAAAPYSAGRAAPGKQYEPVLAQTAKPLPASAQGKAPSTFEATVDVYFHVITAGQTGNLTSRQINDQIRVLNQTYAGQEGGANTGFSFSLAGVTRTDNLKWYEAKQGAEQQFKKALKQGNDGDMNVYSTSGAAFLGWAYYPQVTDSSQAYLDGIVIDWRTVPGASDAYEGAYDLGETLTHEAGHWLNLAHTFDGGCSEPGDFVDDTPPMSVPTGGCPEGKDSCPDQPGFDPIHNYMDYSYDTCYTEFTDGQTQRMRDAWLLYRAD